MSAEVHHLSMLLPVTAQPQLTHSEPRVLVLNWPGVIATWHRGQRRVSSLIGHPIRVCGRTHKLTCPRAAATATSRAKPQCGPAQV